ncbi:MAG TPA: polysaccharide biosynthesis/export family protein [Blastocatellia bacterium]|nr:polysaccharide biosynthesis/export family protein [Blastocatellia bacterium]
MNKGKKTHAQIITMILRSLSLLLVVSCIAFVGRAQSNRTGQTGSGGVTTGTSTAQPSGRGSSAVLVSPEEDYRIGPNDVIEVQIENMPDISKTYRITAAGTFLMSYAGRITAAKKTTEELAQLIADKLRGDYLKDPKVTVAVKEYNSRSFFIQGSVRSPGVYQIEGRPSVLELITLASGLSEAHGANAYIIRRIKTQSTEPRAEGASVSTSGKSKEAGAGQEASDDAPRYELKSANINALLRGQLDQDVFLEPGDIVNIPPTDVFFVAGEVNQPGSFPLKEGTTLRQAISLAQGTNFKAALDKCIIFRESSANKREEVRVDVGAVMNGKKEDVAIMGNDLIYVPNSRTKSIGGALLRAFGLSTVARLPLP